MPETSAQSITPPIQLLVVDDEADMRNGLSRNLKTRGYRVSMASTGEEAVRQAGEVSPDGVLMDIRMPGINGVEAFRRIRDKCPGSFVIFMTAHSDLSDEAAILGAGEVLIKPFDFARLCRHIEDRATQSRSRNESQGGSRMGSNEFYGYA